MAEMIFFPANIFLSIPCKTSVAYAEGTAIIIQSELDITSAALMVKCNFETSNCAEGK
jgi:hypothetical protein